MLRYENIHMYFWGAKVKSEATLLFESLMLGDYDYIKAERSMEQSEEITSDGSESEEDADLSQGKSNIFANI